MFQDPMSLLSAYMQGSRFAQDNIDRARARENEDTKRMVDAGMGVLLSHTTRVNPQTGQVELRPEAEIWKDPQFLRDFSDTAFGQQVLREGMTDEQKKSVDKIVPVRATQISANKAGAPEYGIEVEWRDKEGKPISRGPIAVDANGQRSASDDAMVVPIKTSDVFHTALSKAYQYNPDWAKQYQATLLNASKQSLVNQWMRDPDNRAAIEQQYALAGGDPSEFSKLTKYDLEKRPYTVQDPSGVTKTVNPDRTTTITYDPEAAKVGDQVAAKETENLVKRQSSLSEGRLTFDEATNDRQLKLDADKITNQYETQLRNKLTHSEDELKLEAARIANNYVTNLGLDKQYAGEKLKLLTEEIIARVKATAGANYEAAPTNKKTNEVLNPVQAQDEEGLLKAREFFKAKPIEQVTQDDVLTQGKNLDRPGLLGLRAGLLARIERHDASAGRPLASVNALLNQLESSSKGEAAKPGEFNEKGVKDWTADLPTDQKNQVRLRGRQLYEDAAKVFPTVKGSQEDTDLNMAVGEALRENLPNHVLPLVNWTQLQKNPDYAAGAGSSREFIENIHTPAVELSKQRGLSLSPNALSGVERMAVGLKSRGIPDSDAVVTSIDLEKDPTRVDKIARLLPAGVSPAEREKVFLDILAADLRKTRFAGLKVNPNGPKPSTIGRGGLWR